MRNQTGGGCVVPPLDAAVNDFPFDCHRELLAKFNAELIETVDAPDHALDEHLVLVEGQQRAETARREFVDDDRRTAVPARHRALRVRRGLPLEQRFTLGQCVGQQPPLVFGAVVRSGEGEHEFDAARARALVEQLVKRMLAVGALAAPGDRRGVLADRFAVGAHPLAVTFHLQLLQIGGQLLQPMVVGQYDVAVRAEKVQVP